MIGLRKFLQEHWPFAAVVALGFVVFLALGWWLARPAKNGTIAVAATTGSLTLDVLCRERLVWDLGPGRMQRRGDPPGTEPRRVGGLTITLLGGARVRVDSLGPGVFHFAVENAEALARECGRTGSAFQIEDDGGAVKDDPVGMTYAAEPTAGPAANPISLPLSGRVVLGQAVQQGAGWSARPAGVLESGTVTLRVVPAFSEERVTLGSEQLDEGSLLDTHACLDAPAKAAGPCPDKTAPPALGYFRAAPQGGLKVQLYARGPIGVQAFGAAEQHQIAIPNSTVAWRSDLLKFWGASLGAVLLFWAQVVSLSKVAARVVKDPAGTLHEFFIAPDKHTGEAISKGQMSVTTNTYDAKPTPEARSGDQSNVAAVLLLVGLASLGFVPSTGKAEPVEIKQDQFTGAGYSFRRGASCVVLTAQHVVKEIGVPITVLDRTGAKAAGSRTYANEAYDLALVALPDNSPVACTATWPDPAWLRGASFGSKSEFRAIRHYPGGQEVIVYLKHAGGDKDRLTLAPVDAVTIRESDSGSIVELDGKLAGIVQSVATDTQRVSVLRFDRIDALVGERFRKSAGGGVVSFAGVFFNGRPNPNWGTYVQAWISEKAGRTVVPSAAAAKLDPKPVCEVKVDVVAWERVAAANPELGSIGLQEKACGKKGFLYEQLCKQAKESKAAATPQVQSQKTTMNIAVTPTGAAPQTRLVQSTHTPANSRITHAEIESAALQSAVAPTLTELLALGGCN